MDKLVGFLKPLLFISVFFAAGCSPFSAKKPATVLILLESFSEQDFLCGDEGHLDGLNDLASECENFIRFTHVYAPSSLTQPNLASLFTGKSVNEHGVVHNGVNGLSARFTTLAEHALRRKMRTGLFSGGAPLVQKAGLRQGFEKVRDSFNQKNSQFFVPMQRVVDRSLSWVRREVAGDPFFLTIYSPDLLYQDKITIDNLDDERPISRVSNINEIYESINNLIHELKKMKRYESTNLIILGLGGVGRSLNTPNPISRFHMRVPLQVKLASKLKTNIEDRRGDLLSFSTIGFWIENLLTHESLKEELLFSPVPEGRVIPQQFRLAEWLGLSNWAVVGVRRKEYLFAMDKELLVYDSFADTKELEPLSSQEGAPLALQNEVDKKLLFYFRDLCIPSETHGCQPKITNEKALRAISFIDDWDTKSWQSEEPADTLTQLIQKASKDMNPIVLNWLAYKALYQKQWANLFELGHLADQRAWKLVAQANLRENDLTTPEGCLSYFVGERIKIDNFYRICQDSELRKIVEGINQLRNKQKPGDSFWAQVHEIKQLRQAKNLNLKMQFINDIYQPFDFAPKLSELYFFLPENIKFLPLIDVDQS